MPRAVVAIGGNSLIKNPAHQTVEDQYQAASETTDHIAELIAGGWDLVIVHGNGPQVGFILRRSELAAHELHEVPLDACGADTQGAIGYALQQNLQNDLRRIGVSKRVVSIVTQVEVDGADPAFQSPSKPIGSFMDADKAAERRADGWDMVEDAGRGWRRVVASPEPKRIVELDTIGALLDSGTTVIAVGGGGIPVVAQPDGDLRGVAAVIDKDRAAALVGVSLGAELLLISTGVEKVALDFGRPDQVDLDEITLEQARRHLAEGTHFAKGSMAPKIEAAISFLEGGGKLVVITDPEHLGAAVAGRTGTRIVP
ncbi:MAG TPA: carbamate kinase [Acidimicrobiia bacterium]